MNNNIKRLTRITAENIYEIIKIAIEDPSSEKEILKGGGLLTKLLMTKPVETNRISKDAFKLCRKNNVNIIDYFLLGRDSIALKRKYGNFFSSNKKTIEGCKEVGHFITFDHNIPNKMMINEIFKIIKRYYDRNKEFCVKKIISLLNKQSIDIITIEENQKLKEYGLNHSGTKEERDALCSPKIKLNDIWLTPKHIINQFFETSKLNKNKCFDPCASDGRWLDNVGYSSDILPMNNKVEEKDFLIFEKMPNNTKYIVGNIPFSLTKEFVEKAFELIGEAYFLVNGDTIMNYYNGHINKIWIINGVEGNQKDYRSKCEFETIVLKKSGLWCCIVHLTKEKQEKFIIEKDISNEEKRDGYHIALGRNTYIKSKVLIEENKRIIRLKTEGTICY